MISRGLIAASTKPIILAILKKGENYGYQIIQNVRQISGGKLEWTEPMFYPLLKRMEKDGLIKSQWRLCENKRHRKYYQLTELGAMELEKERTQWLIVHSAFMKILEPIQES